MEARRWRRIAHGLRITWAILGPQATNRMGGTEEEQTVPIHTARYEALALVTEKNNRIKVTPKAVKSKGGEEQRKML
ncbi:hypothetical protein B296_00044888 [Ensete ventricosum]|uniref:Uncharacterized protein n=1 Tax=Ensete ventricosum TaxID=4639 RepID=A0A426Z054_ENSVE|nr:hypothetical protein B296_00044888 [Ensete ventricosum]